MAAQEHSAKDASPTVIAVDVGNTRAKFGAFRTDRHGLPVCCHLIACVLDETESLSAALSDWVSRTDFQPPDFALIAGSDPDLRDELFERWPINGCRPVLIHHFSQIPIQVDVDFPERVGIDRLLNTFAAWRFAGGTCPVIAVDSGTATTVDLMTADGTFRGGSILPGLRLSAFAMHDYTARLPLLNTDDELSELPRLPGRNTEQAMRAGLFIGQLGAVRELSAGLREASLTEFRQTQAPATYVTGGGGRQLVSRLPGAVYIDALALNGLALLP